MSITNKKYFETAAENSPSTGKKKNQQTLPIVSENERRQRKCVSCINEKEFNICLNKHHRCTSKKYLSKLLSNKTNKYISGNFTVNKSNRNNEKCEQNFCLNIVDSNQKYSANKKTCQERSKKCREKEKDTWKSCIKKKNFNGNNQLQRKLTNKKPHPGCIIRTNFKKYEPTSTMNSSVRTKFPFRKEINKRGTTRSFKCSKASNSAYSSRCCSKSSISTESLDSCRSSKLSDNYKSIAKSASKSIASIVEEEQFKPRQLKEISLKFIEPTCKSIASQNSQYFINTEAANNKCLNCGKQKHYFKSSKCTTSNTSTCLEISNNEQSNASEELPSSIQKSGRSSSNSREKRKPNLKMHKPISKHQMCTCEQKPANSEKLLLTRSRSKRDCSRSSICFASVGSSVSVYCKPSKCSYRRYYKFSKLGAKGFHRPEKLRNFRKSTKVKIKEPIKSTISRKTGSDINDECGKRNQNTTSTQYVNEVKPESAENDFNQEDIMKNILVDMDKLKKDLPYKILALRVSLRDYMAKQQQILQILSLKNSKELCDNPKHNYRKCLGVNVKRIGLANTLTGSIHSELHLNTLFSPKNLKTHLTD